MTSNGAFSELDHNFTFSEERNNAVKNNATTQKGITSKGV